MATRRAAILLLGGAGLAGCASVHPKAEFPAVQSEVSQRIDKEISWLTATAADRAVADRISAMLSAPLDANGAVQIALLNNRNLQAKYEDLGVAQAELVEAGLLRNPVFDGSVRFLEGGADPVNLDFGVAFEFLDVFFIPLRKNIAAARLEAAKAEVAVAVLDLAGRTRLAFYGAQSAQQIAEMRRQVEQATAASYDLARRLREAGNNRPLDLANEQALHEEARSALAAAELEAAAAREQLTALMGLWGERASAWMVAARLPDPTGDERPADGIERLAVERSLDLASARAAIDISLRELGVAKPMGVLSELELGAVAERDDGEWEAGPSVALPIPVFSQGQPAVARAQAEIRRSQQAYYATAVELRSAVRTSHARVQVLRQRVDHYRSVLLPLRQQIVSDTQRQYNAMQVGAFQLLQAKRDQIEAGAAYLTLLRDYWVAKAELELILSGKLVRLDTGFTSDRAAMPSPANPSKGH